jgi:hypothetical protein
MIERIIAFIKAEWNHWKQNKIIQVEEQLVSDILRLEKQYKKTNSNYIYEELEYKRQQLANLQGMK